MTTCSPGRQPLVTQGSSPNLFSFWSAIGVYQLWLDLHVFYTGPIPDVQKITFKEPNIDSEAVNFTFGVVPKFLLEPGEVPFFENPMYNHHHFRHHHHYITYNHHLDDNDRGGGTHSS